MSTRKWLLVETFGGDRPPCAIGIGNTPKKFVPLTNIVKARRNYAEVATVIAETAQSCELVNRLSHDCRRRMLGMPVTAPGAHTPQRVHAVHVWVGPSDAEVPNRNPVGAWYFNLATHTSRRSDELLDLYGVAPENRAEEHSIASMFTRVVTNSDEGEALAKLLRSAPGTEHQAIWTINRDDGVQRAAHFSCRMIEETSAEGRPEVLLRGVTHDIGEAEATICAPPPVILERRVLEASVAEGEYRGIVDLRTLRLVRWIGAAMPGIAWEGLAGQNAPQIHPDDFETARAMSKSLAIQDRAVARVRVKTLDGQWRALDIKASLMALDQHTTAAFVSVREAAH